jgi:hypothetical protein
MIARLVAQVNARMQAGQVRSDAIAGVMDSFAGAITDALYERECKAERAADQKPAEQAEKKASK